MIAPLVWSPLWKAMEEDRDKGGEQWIPTTEAMYDEMLGVVPPERMVQNAFVMGEPVTSTGSGEDVFAAFRNRNGQFEARYMTLKQFDAIFK